MGRVVTPPSTASMRSVQTRTVGLLSLPESSKGADSMMSHQRAKKLPLTPMPYFCLYRGAFIPCAIAWNPETGRFTRF